MLPSDAVRQIISSRGYTQAEAAKLIGITSGGLSASFRKGNPTVDALYRYLKPMGYSIVLVPEGSKLPDGSYLLESNKPEITVDLDDPGLMLG